MYIRVWVRERLGETETEEKERGIEREAIRVCSHMLFVCVGLPVTSESGSQLGQQPAPSPCPAVVLELCLWHSATFSPHLSCPVCSDSWPGGTSAEV